MNARQTNRPPPAPPALSLFTGHDDQADTRIINPAVARAEPLASYFEQVAEAHQDRLQPLPPDERRRVKLHSTVQQFYDAHMRPLREEQLAGGEVSKGTLEKEQQAVRYFSEWDLRQAPRDWPDDVAWPGLPIGYLTGPYLESWIKSLLTERGLRSGSVSPLWYQLRTVVNHAVKLKVLDRAPRPSVSSALESVATAAADDDLVPTTFTTDELEAIYRALAGEVEMQVALVVGAAVGPRTGDLFGLRWGSNVRLRCDPPEIWYRAEKTGKRHWVPLHPVTVRQLLRLARPLLPGTEEGRLVFPSLTSDRNKDPESSRAARRRNALMKGVLRSLGLPADDKTSDYYRPWQVLRSTCNSRLNNHRPGVGRLVTHGKDADVSSQHYWDAKPLILEGVLTLPQPAAFTA